jgi:hypothetical protein
MLSAFTGEHGVINKKGIVIQSEYSEKEARRVIDVLNKHEVENGRKLEYHYKLLTYKELAELR